MVIERFTFTSALAVMDMNRKKDARKQGLNRGFPLKTFPIGLPARGVKGQKYILGRNGFRPKYRVS